MNKYSKAHTCQRCGKVFPKAYKLMRHERGCEARVKHVYPGGVYTPPKNIFDKMEEEGIQVPEDLKFSKYFATFDIEVFYPKSSQVRIHGGASTVIGQREQQCTQLPRWEISHCGR